MRESKKIAIFLFVLFNFVLAFKAQASSSNVVSEQAIEQAILVEVNAYRIKHHLNPLKMNAQIAQQAKIHSLNMAKHKVPFGHTHFMSRVKAIRQKVKNSGAAAENVAYNYKDAQDVVKNWLLSPGHKKNIRGNYNLTGIGVVRDGRGKIHFTQIFVKTGTNHYVSKTRTLPHFSFGPFFKKTHA